MTDSASETITTRFLTWHQSAEDLHVRTESRVLFVSREHPELVERFKKLRRGSAITVTGTPEFSKTLSTHVLNVKALS